MVSVKRAKTRGPTALVMQLYGHPDEDHARDRLKMAFATDAGSERDAPLRRMGSEGVAGRSPK
jgi:hypothetical protein